MSIKSTLNDVLDAVKRQAGTPVSKRRHIHVSGLPGWGKTKGLEGLSPLSVTLPCPLLSKEDICVPIYNKDTDKLTLKLHPMLEGFIAKAKANPKVPAVKAKANPKVPAVMIFDEIMQSAIVDQKGYASMIYDRVIAGETLPPNVITVSTGNERKHQSGAGQSMAHLIGRMKLYTIEANVEEWLEWGADRLHSDVMAYLAMKPAAALALSDDPSDEDMSNMYRAAARDFEPYPSARSWTALSDELNSFPNMAIADLASHVGEARAREFSALRGMQVPTNDDLLKGKSPWPEEPMAQWVAIINLGRGITPAVSEDTINLVKNLSPSMVEVFLNVAGRQAQAWLKQNGKTVPKSPKMALMSFPKFRETLFEEGSRYALALEESA
jgi:hypothetical protein